MEDQPIYRQLVEMLLSGWGAGLYRVIENPWIEKYLKEDGSTVSSGETWEEETIIAWDMDKETIRQCADEAIKCKYVVFDCPIPEDTIWGSRFFSQRGYSPHPEMTQKVAELNWGCRVLEKVERTQVQLVSVVIPTYNSEKFIEECLKSILAQTHPNLEIILVDDCSTDNTVAIASRILDADKRDHFIIQLQEWVTAAAVRNVGVKESVGDFICCFDSDDFMPYNYLETALRHLDEDLDFVYPRQWWDIPEDDWEDSLGGLQDLELPEITYENVPWRCSIFRYRDCILYLNSEDFEKSSGYNSCMIMPAVFRYSSPPIFDPDLPRLQDWDMYLELIGRGVKGRGFFCPPFIRKRQGSITSLSSGIEYKECREQVAKAHNLPCPPKLLILPLNSSGNFETTLGGPRIRGCNMAPYIWGSELGDLDTLRHRWREFDAFYFVCAPTPGVTGWAKYLVDQGKRVLFDVCVSYWSDDYLFKGFKKEDFTSCLISLSKSVDFICASEGLKRELGKIIDPIDNIHVVPDSVHPSAKIKESYEFTGRVCWCGCPGNMTELLAFTLPLTKFTNKTGATVRIISEKMEMRVPFKWEWRKWSLSHEEDFITGTDIYLLPDLRVGSFEDKGCGKFAKADILGMPIARMCFEGWEDYLSLLYESQEEREKCGRDNLLHASRNDITPLVAEKLIQILGVKTGIL